MTRRRDGAILAGLVLAAALLRASCLRTELWIDEIWSLNFARGAKSALGVFLDIHHDNSHPINTLWLYFVSGSRDWAVFRLLSFACGVLTVAALGVDPEDRPRGLLTAALAALSVPLILYSTEARGYAPMALCAVVCRLLLAGPRPPSTRRAAAFALVATLGLFSQALFACVLAALFVEALAKFPRKEHGRTLLALFGPPALLFALYALNQLGRMQFGLGSSRSFSSAAIGALAQWAGAPSAGPLSLFGAAVLAALCVVELARLRRERPLEFRFYATLFAAAVAPVAAVAFRSERYFFACAPFALILAAGSLARLLRGGRAARAAGAALIGLFALGGAVQVRALATAGRGHYMEAVQRMGAETPGDVVTVGSDHDFRNGMLLDYYAAYLPPSKRLVYVHAEERAASPPDWIVTHGQFTDARLAPIALTYPGAPGVYRLVEVYPYAGLSGWTWMLYRRG